MTKSNMEKSPPKGSVRFSLSLSPEQKKAKISTTEKLIHNTSLSPLKVTPMFFFRVLCSVFWALKNEEKFSSFLEKFIISGKIHHFWKILTLGRVRLF